MKLLIDQNLSYRIATILQGDYPGSVATRDVGLAKAGDETIWSFAARGGFTIVSKDADFGQRSSLMGFPPRVIWLVTGNCSTQEIIDLIRDSKADIDVFERSPRIGLLVLPQQ